MKINWISKLCMLAAVAVLSTTSFAIFDQAKISINRTANSRTIAVKYTGAAATVVEFRLNGTSLGTRQVSGDKTDGQANFELDIASLNEGENEVEIRIFDKDGKLLGSEKSVITSPNSQGPVHLVSPRTGETVQGPLDIKVGFVRDMKNVFVSYFVDSQFRAMSNTPPYDYLWDSVGETNGWHEVEAWIVDEQSHTFKTKKVRIFVNNPGGRTERLIAPLLKPISNPNVPVTGPATTVRPVTAPEATVAAAATAVVSTAGVRTLATNSTTAVEVGPISTTRTLAASATTSMATSVKLLTPTGKRNAVAPRATTKLPNFNVLPDVNTSTVSKRISISKGTRLKTIGSIKINYNGEPVNFDVAPRVQNGIPLTPFRHLFEKAGGEVTWNGASKTVDAQGHGRQIFIRIGDRIAMINKLEVEMELAPFIERGRTILPLSFIKESLDVQIDYDVATNHVLITSAKKK